VDDSAHRFDASPVRLSCGLSFPPQSPDPGFHILELKLKVRPELKVRVRNAYWSEAETAPVQK